MNDKSANDLFGENSLQSLTDDFEMQTSCSTGCSPMESPRPTFSQTPVICSIDPFDKLEIIAQPRAFYRERYSSEIDPNKRRAQRFIRAETDGSQNEYPTITIPAMYCNQTGRFYIQVALVTIPSQTNALHYIHPYPINTSERGVICDPQQNALYFPISDQERSLRRKSFRISRKKMTQNDLKSYGPLRLSPINEENYHDFQNSFYISDPKQIIQKYELWKSQLVFTIFEYDYSEYFKPFLHTTVISKIMCDSMRERPQENTFITNIGIFLNDETIKYAPKKGDWAGGDDILMVIPKLDRRKVIKVYFKYELDQSICDVHLSFVDSKTILFQSPPCPLLMDENDVKVPIIVMQNDSIVSQLEFTYVSLNKQVINSYIEPQFPIINGSYLNSEYPSSFCNDFEDDSGELLVRRMNKLTTNEKTIEANTTNEIESQLDNGNAKLTEAIVEFIRTNNPTELFHRIHCLIVQFEEDPLPLDDAIHNGHTDVALKLTEQIIDKKIPNYLHEPINTDGETPLLLAAKFNHIDLIKLLLENHSALVKQVDKFQNNILHLLANVPHDQANDTIKIILNRLPENIKLHLLKAKNEHDQIPYDIAQIQNNIKCISLLTQSQ